MPRDFPTLLSRLLAFREERDWSQFHTPKDLALALGIEAAEVQERFLWQTDAQIETLRGGEGRDALADELADVLIYLTLLAHHFGIDLLEATATKIEKNAARYPVELARGKATKYTELGQ